MTPLSAKQISLDSPFKHVFTSIFHSPTHYGMMVLIYFWTRAPSDVGHEKNEGKTNLFASLLLEILFNE